MKAITYSRTGDSSVLHLQDREVPDPDTGQDVSIYRDAALDTTYRFAVINTGTRNAIYINDEKVVKLPKNPTVKRSCNPGG